MRQANSTIREKEVKNQPQQNPKDQIGKEAYGTTLQTSLSSGAQHIAFSPDVNGILHDIYIDGLIEEERKRQEEEERKRREEEERKKQEEEKKQANSTTRLSLGAQHVAFSPEVDRILRDIDIQIIKEEREKERQAKRQEEEERKRQEEEERKKQEEAKKQENSITRLSSGTRHTAFSLDVNHAPRDIANYLITEDKIKKREEEERKRQEEAKRQEEMRKEEERKRQEEVKRQEEIRKEEEREAQRITEEIRKEKEREAQRVAEEKAAGEKYLQKLDEQERRRAEEQREKDKEWLEQERQKRGSLQAKRIEGIAAPKAHKTNKLMHPFKLGGYKLRQFTTDKRNHRRDEYDGHEDIILPLPERDKNGHGDRTLPWHEGEDKYFQELEEQKQRRRIEEMAYRQGKKVNKKEGESLDESLNSCHTEDDTLDSESHDAVLSADEQRASEVGVDNSSRLSARLQSARKGLSAVDSFVRGVEMLRLLPPEHAKLVENARITVQLARSSLSALELYSKNGELDGSAKDTLLVEGMETLAGAALLSARGSYENGTLNEESLSMLSDMSAAAFATMRGSYVEAVAYSAMFLKNLFGHVYWDDNIKNMMHNAKVNLEKGRIDQAQSSVDNLLANLRKVQGANNDPLTLGENDSTVDKDAKIFMRHYYFYLANRLAQFVDSDLYDVYTVDSLVMLDYIKSKNAAILTNDNKLYLVQNGKLLNKGDGIDVVERKYPLNMQYEVSKITDSEVHTYIRNIISNSKLKEFVGACSAEEYYDGLKNPVETAQTYLKHINNSSTITEKDKEAYRNQINKQITIAMTKYGAMAESAFAEGNQELYQKFLDVLDNIKERGEVSRKISEQASDISAHLKSVSNKAREQNQQTAQNNFDAQSFVGGVMAEQQRGSRQEGMVY